MPPYVLIVVGLLGATAGLYIEIRWYGPFVRKLVDRFLIK
jgi:hypothetical protein